MLSGQSYLENGDLERAIADFDQAIELDPDLAAAYQGRAWAYMQKGEVGRVTDYDAADDDTIVGSQSDLDHAIADFDQAIELDPDVPLAYLDRGLAYSLKGDPDRAIVDYDQAIELDPDDAEAYRRRGNACLDKGDLDRAIADLNRAIELDPDNPYTYNGRAMVYHLKGNLDLAIADLDRVIELTPEDGQAYKNRGWVCVEKGDTERAIADYREFWKLSDDPADRQFAEEQLALLGTSP